MGCVSGVWHVYVYVCDMCIHVCGMFRWVVCVDGRDVCVCVVGCVYLCVVCVTRWLTPLLSDTASLPVPVQAGHPLHHTPRAEEVTQP